MIDEQCDAIGFRAGRYRPGRAKNVKLSLGKERGVTGWIAGLRNEDSPIQ